MICWTDSCNRKWWIVERPRGWGDRVYCNGREVSEVQIVVDEYGIKHITKIIYCNIM